MKLNNVYLKATLALEEEEYNSEEAEKLVLLLPTYKPSIFFDGPPLVVLI